VFAIDLEKHLVTKNEFNIIFNPIAEQLKTQLPDRGKLYQTEYAKAHKKVLNDLIERELILSEFGEQGASIPDRVVNKEVQSRINEIYNGDSKAFYSELSENNISREKYKDIVRRTMLVSFARSQHFTNVTPTSPAELQAEYAKFKDKLRDITKDKVAYKKIWIPNIEMGRDESLAKAKKLASQIRSGASFSALAKEHSFDIYADEGGQWPLTGRFDVPAYFSKIIFEANVGQLLGPLEGPNGFHIIMVTRKVSGPAPPISKLKPQLENRIQARKSSVRFKRWIERLRKRAIIKVY